MQFEYFDAHSHLYFPDYDEDREEEIQKMKKAKIGTICVATDFASSKKVIDLAEKHENIFACIGQHPSDLTINSVFEEKLQKLAEHKKVVAIGECGLDYFRLPDDPAQVAEIKSIQKTIFEYHIDLALTNDLPLMLHIRSTKGTNDAYYDALEILEKHDKLAGERLRGNAHFFAGDTDILRRLIAIDFTASYTGVITFTRDYDELIKYTPLGMILSETDAPFVAPVPYRGKRNSPLFIPEIVQKIAEVKNEPLEVVKTSIMANILRVFNRIA